jgi:hypothetical protein
MGGRGSSETLPARSLRRWGVLAFAAVLVAIAATAGGEDGRAARLDPPPGTAPPACFGAASRDPDRPCHNPSLRLEVTPSPARALTLPNSPCLRVPDQDAPPVCTFGAAPAGARRTIALVGDSHAGHWRAALAVVARERGWYGLSITHSSCPLQTALRDLPEPKRTLCARWKPQVFAWFARHPEVSAVFVAGLTGGSGVVPTRGRSAFATSEAGYAAAWRALPATVKHIVVIRDTPKGYGYTNRCVARAMKAAKPAGAACTVPRRRALDPDPAIVAARRLASPRVQTVDLTTFFCGARSCDPVIGGALVRRDNTHLTGVFSATLAPYLERSLDRLTAGWD